MKRYDFASLLQLAGVPEATQSRLLEILDLASHCGYPPLVVGLYPIRAGAAQWFDGVVNMPPEKYLITRLLLLEQLSELEPPPPEPNLYEVCLHIARSYRDPKHGWSVESLLLGDCGLSATRVFITLFELHSATLERLRTFTYHEFGDYQMIAALTPRFVLPQLGRKAKSCSTMASTTPIPKSYRLCTCVGA